MSLLRLPLDVLVTIVKHLDLSDLRNVMLTCKTLREIIINDNSIWRLISRNRLIIGNSRDNSHFITQSYYNQSRISHNWCKGIYRSKVLIYHSTNYMPWLKLHNSEVLLLSVGSELRCYSTDKKGFPVCKDFLWRLEVPKVKRNDVRTNDISRFKMKYNHIVCGNRDGCIAVYKFNDVKHKPLLLGHVKDCHEHGQIEVTDVELINNISKLSVVTVSNSSPVLCIWLSTPGEDIYNTSPVGHSAHNRNMEMSVPNCVGIRCLAANSFSDKLAIGPNGNSKPLLFDVTTGQLLMTADATRSVKEAIRDIEWHNENTMMFVTHSGNLNLLDVRNGAVIFDMMDPFQSSLYCVKSDGRHAIVVGSSEYSRCVLFDTRNCRRHIQMYFTQKKSSPIYSLDFDSTKLIAAADRSIAGLNFNVNSTMTQLRDYSHTFEFINR